MFYRMHMLSHAVTRKKCPAAIRGHRYILNDIANLNHSDGYRETTMPDAGNVFAWFLSTLAILISGPSGAADPSPVALSVVGLNGTEIRITADQWARLPHEAVDVVDHGGSRVHFEGVPAREILKVAGAPLGKELRGGNLAVFVVAEAADGYRVVYALTEFDDGFKDSTILVADKRDGKALAAEEGPLRIVVPGEKRQGRWTRQLVALKLDKAQ